MLQYLHCFGSQKHVLGLRRSTIAISSLSIVVAALALTTVEMCARAADDAISADGSPSVDFLDRAHRLHGAAQRVEELNQEAWRALGKDGEVGIATMTMSRAAELARSEFGRDHWLARLRESIASGMAALAELKQPQRQLFIEAMQGQSVAAFQWSQGHKERALTQMRQACEKRTQALGADHIFSAESLLDLAFHESALGDYRTGKRHAAEAVRIVKMLCGEKSPAWAHALYYRAMAEAGLREFESAERDLGDAIEILEPAAREGISEFYLMMYSDAQLQLSRLLNEQERYADAEPFARRGSEILAFAQRQAYGRYVESQLDVVRSVSGQGKAAEAEIIFACLFKSLPANPPPEVISTILARYAEHLRRVHRDVDAEQLDARIRKLSAQNPNPRSNSDTGSKAAHLVDVPAATQKK